MASKNKASRKTWVVILSVGLIFSLMVIIGFSMGWIGGGPSGQEVDISRVVERDIIRMVTATGTIQPEIEVKIAPDVSGEIVELRVREGDFVYEGDLLLRIRPDIIQARLDETNASLLSQMARLEQTRASKLRAQNEYEQKRALFARAMISQFEYENARRAYEAEQASFKASSYQVENARAQLRRIEEELRQTTVRAPMTGTVSKLSVERGERVVGSIQMTGTEMLRIARMEQMEVRVNVNENDIVYVSETDTARIEVDAYPGRIFVGIVTEIANSAVTRGTGTAEQITEYPVKIRVLSPHNPDMERSGRNTRNPGTLQPRSIEMVRTVSPVDMEVRLEESPVYFKPGMTATVDIETLREYNVPAVPLQSVTMRDFSLLDSDEETALPEDMRRVVFRVKGDTAEMVEVHTGISDDRFIHIVHGLNKDDEIVSGNYRVLSRVLKDGDLVRPRNQGREETVR